jgi:hypothetical protein
MTVPWRQLLVFYEKTVSCGAELTVATNLTLLTTVCLPGSIRPNPLGNFPDLLASQAAQGNKKSVTGKKFTISV